MTNDTRKLQILKAQRTILRKIVKILIREVVNQDLRFMPRSIGMAEYILKNTRGYK